MTPEERQQLSQFASDNVLCMTLDGDAIVDVSRNEPWRRIGERLVCRPYRMMDLSVDDCAVPASDEVADSASGERRRDPAEIARRRKANKAARKARRNRQ